jgi:hypothetical protein
VTWLAPTSYGTAAAAGYQVRWSATGTRSFGVWAAARSAWRQVGWVKGHVYYVQVRAVNKYGPGPTVTLRVVPTR